MRRLTNRPICIFSTSHVINDDKDFLSSLPRDLHKQFKQKKVLLHSVLVCDQVVALPPPTLAGRQYRHTGAM